MFFALSKVAGEVLVTPYYLALVALALALTLRLARRGSRLRRALAWGALAWVWLTATGVIANALLYPLESRHPRPARAPASPAAIVMLSGTTDDKRVGVGGVELTESADRFVEAVRLAHAHPRALLVLSGGSSVLVGDRGYREAEALAGLARELGVARERILVDRESRNTRENAVEVARLLSARKLSGPLLLVTSALHMPRSLGCFAKVGLDPVPWPTDYQRTRNGPGAFLPKPGSLGKSTAALHEYLGWLAYRAAGYL
jgi:uncharacterized SAM-binding protein YcdF (DUF218 family)